MHAPWTIRCLLDTAFRRNYTNIYYNTKIYDGLTRNDFKKGNLIQFMYKIGAIDQSESFEEDDGRGYFIGYKDDD